MNSNPNGASSEDSQSFAKLLNVKAIDRGDGRATFELTVQQRHLRSLGIMHGGVAASLLDTCMGVAAGTLSPPGHYVVTVQLNVNFIRPAWQGETLRASGEVKHSGRQTAVAAGELRTSEGVLVGTGTATFLFVPHADSIPATIEKHEDAAERRSPEQQS